MNFLLTYLMYLQGANPEVAKQMMQRSMMSEPEMMPDIRPVLANFKLPMKNDNEIEFCKVCFENKHYDKAKELFLNNDILYKGSSLHYLQAI